MAEPPQSITALPHEEELAGRLERVRALMKKKRLDCCVSFDPVNICCRTNFANNVHERSFILIIPSRGTPVIDFFGNLSLYHSLKAWAFALGINLFGIAPNVIAAAGLFDEGV